MTSQQVEETFIPHKTRVIDILLFSTSSYEYFCIFSRTRKHFLTKQKNKLSDFFLCHFFLTLTWEKERKKNERTTTNKKFTSIPLDFTEFSIFSTSLSCFLAPFASFFCVATREWKITHMRNFLQYFINKLFSRFHCLFAWSAERVLWLGTSVGGLRAGCTLRWWRIYQPQCQIVSQILLFCFLRLIKWHKG